MGRQRDQVEGAACIKLDELMARTQRTLDQRPKDERKQYALQCAESCMHLKGHKPHTFYEFGFKVYDRHGAERGLFAGNPIHAGQPL